MGSLFSGTYTKVPEDGDLLHSWSSTLTLSMGTLVTVTTVYKRISLPNIFMGQEGKKNVASGGTDGKIKKNKNNTPNRCCNPFFDLSIM